MIWCNIFGNQNLNTDSTYYLQARHSVSIIHNTTVPIFAPGTTLKMMVMLMNYFCYAVDQQKAFSLVSSRDYCQKSASLQISDMPRAGFESLQKLSLGLAEWSCAVMITTTPWHNMMIVILFLFIYNNTFLLQTEVLMRLLIIKQNVTNVNNTRFLQCQTFISIQFENHEGIC